MTNKTNIRSVIILYKPESYTPLETIRLFQKKHPEYNNIKLSYAGRLDPMAEGVLVVLAGNENKNRKNYEKLDKTYEFEAILGVSTDSFDMLGLINNTKHINENIVQEKNIISALNKLKFTKIQKYPPYSSAVFKGKPLYYWSRINQLNKKDIPSHKINIYKLKLIRFDQKKIYLDKIINKIKKVNGKFRQDQIIVSWKNYFGKEKSIYLPYFKAELNCSGGTYVRQLVNDAGFLLSTNAVTWNIKRLSVGNYKISEAIKIEA